MEGRINDICFNQKYITDEFLSEIVKEFISEGKSKNSPHHEFYEKVLNLVETPGFRPGQEPPHALFAKSIKNASKKNNTIFLGLMLAWRDINNKLKDIVAKYLKDNLEEKVNSQNDFDDGINKIVQAIYLTKDNKYEKHEIALMVYLELKLPNKETIDNETDLSQSNLLIEESLNKDEVLEDSKWKKVIDDVSKWSAYDQEWDKINDFVKSLMEIAHQKSKEKNEAIEPAKELLSDLRERDEDILYFNLPNIKYWDIEKVELEKIIDLQEKLRVLDQKISESSNWRKRREKTSQDRRKKNEMLDTIEYDINNIYTELDEMFNSDDLVGKVKKPTELDDGFEKKLNDRDQINDLEGESPKTGNSFMEQGKDDLQNKGEDETDDALKAETPNEIAGRGKLKDRDGGFSQDILQTDNKNNANDLEKNCISTIEVVDKLNDRENKEINLLWDLIRSDDLPSAYCLVEAVSESGKNELPVPTWLIASVQGAYWMMMTGQKYISDLSKISSEHDPSKGGTSFQLMGLSAALIVNLVAPSVGMIHWLDMPNNYKGINKLIESIRELSKTGMSLLKEDIQNVESKSKVEKSIHKCIEDASTIIKESKNQRLSFYRASKVLHYLYSPNQEIINTLQVVVDNNKSKANKVLEFLDKWEKGNYVEDQINKIDNRLHAHKKEAIMGKSKDQLLRYVHNTIITIREWHELTERNSQDGKTWDWRRENANKFRKSFIDLSNDIHDEISDLQSVSNPIEIVAAANCLSKSIKIIEDYMGIGNKDVIETQPNSAWWVDNTNSLESAIAKKLYWFPEIFYDEDDLLLEKDNNRFLEMLKNGSAVDRSLKSIIKIWIDKQDYRFVETLLKGLNDSDSYEEIHKYYMGMFDGSKSTLKSKILDTQASIEKSIINGIISDEEREDISADISLISPDETQNFNKVFNRLDDKQKLLEDKLNKRMDSLVDRWNDIKPTLNNSNKIEEKEKNKIEKSFENMVKDKNSRVLEEWLSSLSERIERGEDYSLSDYDPRSKKTLYEKYLDIREKIEDHINSTDNKLGRLLSAIERGKTWKIIKYGSLPKTQLKQARDVMDNWIQLIEKKHKLEDSDFNKKLMSIFTFIGFTLDNRLYSVKKIKTEANWRLYQIKMSASDLARPFPQLGSLTNGVYDVVCLWQRPGADAVGGLLHDSRLESRNLIVIYFGRMTDYQRKELNAMTRKRKMVVAVLDEILLVYLTSIRDERLKTFLHCSLPLSAINPYMPNIQGDVPSEIFYGRDEIVQDLMRADGGCLVYGGRQMGKSALLRYVMRRFHNPTLNTYAWVEDIKAIGDSLAGEEASQVWIKIRDIFVNMDLIKASRKLTNREKIIQKIRQYMNDNKNSRVLIMLDEADNFLNQDSSNSFREVDELRKLMLNTERRFKVVFAGLHHVQRFQNLPNQPLAHFGYPNLVGPLNSSDATKLVREPIEALGYRLDDACVYLILSYTNYHPGLIQIFCHELVKRLHKLTLKNDFRISIEDIEAVYLNEEVRARIKERFEWTLVLDKRYQVVAYSMIIEQILTKDSYAQSYNAGTLHDLAKGWWADAFSDMTIDNFRNLLNEMRGLGILVPTADNKYRLRSPNLVRLMGTEKDIEDKLLEFSNKQYTIFKTEEDYNSFHEIVDKEKLIFSPLTISQVRNIKNHEFDVGVITASEALGLHRLEETFNKILSKTEIDNHNGLVVIPETIHNSNGFYDYLRDITKKKSSTSSLTLTACQFVDSYSKGLDDAVQSAQSFISENGKKLNKKGFRMYFIVNPETYWNWMLSGSDLRNELEANGSFIALSRWNETGVIHMLELIDKLYNNDVSKKVFDASGGWPVLLEKIIQRVGTETDLRDIANDFYYEFEHNDFIKNSFIKGTGLMVSTDVIEVFKYLIENPGITDEYVTPELIESDLELTDSLCSFALKYLIQFGIVDRKGEFFEVEPFITKMNLFGARDQ